MFLGVHEQYHGKNATTPEASKSRYPRMTITREFKPDRVTPHNLVPSVLKLCQDIWAANLVCNVSLKLSKEHVLNGQWQMYVEQLCRVLTQNGRAGQTILTFWHEAENNTNDSFPVGSGSHREFENGPEFVRYFNTLHDWVKGVNPSIVTSHAALGYAYRPQRGKNDRTAWVVDPTQWLTKADVHAIDFYSGRSFPLSITLNTSSAFSRWYESRNGGKWAVSERGWAAKPKDYVARVQSIGAEFEWLAGLPDTARPVWYIVWLTSGTEDDGTLTPDTTMVAAINNGFAFVLTEPTTPPDEEPPTTMTCPLCHGAGVVPNGTYTVTTNVMATCHD